MTHCAKSEYHPVCFAHHHSAAVQIDDKGSVGLIRAYTNVTTYRVEEYDGDIIIHAESQSRKHNIMDLLEGHLEEGQVLVPLQETIWYYRTMTEMMSKVLSYPLFPTVQRCLYALRGVNQEGNLFLAIHLDNKINYGRACFNG